VTEPVEGPANARGRWRRGRRSVRYRASTVLPLTTAFVVVAAAVAVVFWAKRGDVRPPVDNVSADTR
jgi:hypothetical protein